MFVAKEGHELFHRFNKGKQSLAGSVRQPSRNKDIYIISVD
jgi:hypothetical protein